MSGGYDLVSLSSEYNNQLLSVVINNVNYIPISNFLFLSFINSLLNIEIDRLCLYSIWFKDFICKIFDICNSDPKCECKCNCSCNSNCTGSFICLCECSEPEKGNFCCICICKHKNCKCVCICLCNKTEDKGCGSGEHTCKEFLVKVDIGTLKDQSLQILNYSCWIRCCLSRIENQYCSNNSCCCCNCCANGLCTQSNCNFNCCCKQGKINYLEIISRIHWIELLFKEVGTKISELRTLKNILSLMSAIAKTCKRCCSPETQQETSASNPLILALAFILAAALTAFGVKSNGNKAQKDPCKEKIDSLINNIQKALRYYSLFGSRMGDLRSFVEFKINYSKSKQIIYSLQRSMRPLLKELGEINSDIVNSPNQNMSRNNTSLVQIDKLSMGVYSHYNILSCIFFVMRVAQWAGFINDFLNTNDIPDRCTCVKSFEWNNYFDKFYIEGYSDHTHKINTSILSKLHKQTRENHICLCLVFKYVLYPSIMRSLYFVFGTNLEIHGSINRKFDNYNYHRTFNDDASKMLLFIFHIVSVIISIVSKDSYVQWKSGHPGGVEVKCFCMVDKNGKNYLISIILFVSSLIENIWTMDKDMYQVFVNHLSSLMWEFDMTNNNNRKVEFNETLISLAKGESYFSSLAVTDSGFGLIIGGFNKKSLLILNKPFLQFAQSNSANMYWILIGGPKFNLFYDKFTWLSFNLMNDSRLSLATKDKKLMGIISRRMSHRYLSIQLTISRSSKGSGDCTGCKKFIYKVVYYIICVSRGKFKTLSSQIINTSIIKFIQNKRLKLYEIINYLNKRTIYGTEMILRVTKNKLLNSSSHPNLNTENIVKSRNWGYDTYYEHQVTTLSNHKLSPKLLTVNRGTIDTTQNIVTHLAVVPT